MPNIEEREANARASSAGLKSLVALVAITILICVGTFAAVEIIAKSPLWSEKGAAWIQAVGSVAAIVAAIYVLNKQGEQARRLAVDSDNLALSRRLAALEALVERGFEMAKTVEVHTEPIASYWNYFFTVVRLDQLRFMRDALSAVPLHTLESYKLVVGVHEMIINLEKLEPLVIIHEAAGNVHYIFEGDNKARAKYICKKIREARERVREAIVELGHSPIRQADEVDMD